MTKKTEPARPGRKPSPDGPFDDVLPVGLNSSMKERVENMAWNKRVSAAQYVRDAIKAQLARDERGRGTKS